MKFCVVLLLMTRGAHSDSNEAGDISFGAKGSHIPEYKSVEELFQEGSLIARALLFKKVPGNIETTFFTDLLNKKDANIGNFIGFSEYDTELKFLTQQKDGEGTYKNVERHGQRSRSSTLLVSGLEIPLFNPIGVLYDANKSTIRAYMLTDSHTSFQYDHDGFYTVTKDKAKFEPIISRNLFIEKYREFRKWRDSLTEDEAIQKHVLWKHNEVIGNFFPNSLVGIVADAKTDGKKLKLLALHQYLKTQKNLDLPMIIMDKGKIELWIPNLQEIDLLANGIPELLNSNSCLPTLKKQPMQIQNNIYQAFLKALGYQLSKSLRNKLDKDKNFTWKISKGDLVKIDTRDDHDKLENVQSLSMFSLGKKIAKGKP